MNQNAESTAANEIPIPGPRNSTWAIFLISVFGLFLELLLIRWVATELRIFAYLQNTILVVCFLGIGMGCFTCRKAIRMSETYLPLAVLTLLLAIPFTRTWLRQITTMLSVINDIGVWNNLTSDNQIQTIGMLFAGLTATFLVMALIWDIFVPVGRILGRLLDEHRQPIWAYSVNVAGSLVGTWLIVLMSAFFLPPIAWFAIAVALALFFLGSSNAEKRLNLGFLVVITAAGWFAGVEPGSLVVKWSPYQKLVLREPNPEHGHGNFGTYIIDVNNVGYQGTIDLRPETVASDPEKYPPKMRGLSQYDIPFVVHSDPQRVVVIGTGAGNDAAGALRNGCDSVTAVEIDPVIVAMGRAFHPEHPYDAPSLELVVDDARSFFANATGPYDVISFGLLDSHTTSAMTNARLDHYVYTRESIMQAKSLLADGGIIALSFESVEFITDRMHRLLTEVFGSEPVAFWIPASHYGWGGVMFLAGDREMIDQQIAENPRLKALIGEWKAQRPLNLTGTTPVVTDDWPYLYLPRPTIPVLYYLLAGLLPLLYFRGRRKFAGDFHTTSWSREHWHFFFLGAAFMLLEVQNISKACVALGSTWWVNAVIISAVLMMVLIANAIAASKPQLPLLPVYLILVGTCVGLYFVDISRFAFLPFGQKSIVVGSLTTLPMLFSGIIFVRSFAATPMKDQAFGANMIGALLGGLLPTLTFLTGIRFLLVVVALLYVLAFITRPIASQPSDPSPDSA